MQIGLNLREIKRDQTFGKLLYHPNIGLKVNLYSCLSLTKNGQYKVVKRAKNNDRNSRVRPEETNKSDAPAVAMPTNTKAFAEKQGAYGKEWALKHHNHELYSPCVQEILDGIIAWYVK